MTKIISYWDKFIPICAILAYMIGLFYLNTFGQIAVVVLLIGSILAAVHHSELIAHKVGEPFGTIILAVSITVIEVALIISLMLAGGEKASYLARDTVFAAVMILLTVITGTCILIGSFRHFEQTFEKKSVNTALVALVSIIVLTLILPNFVNVSAEGKFNQPQLVFVSIASLIIYGTFIYVQTIRHRNYFTNNDMAKPVKPLKVNLYANIPFLLISLVIVVLLAKTISPTVEKIIIDATLPQSLLGIVIASIILLPEALAAARAAYHDDFQASINLSLGSALAAIGLTIPAVAAISIVFNIEIVLGLSSLSILLIGLSIFTVMLSLSKGRTNVLYGVVLLILFATYVFTITYS